MRAAAPAIGRAFGAATSDISRRLSSAWTPADLFAGGENGAWFERPLEMTWQDTGKTTPAGAGDTVAVWDDQSGNGYDAVQATAAAEPLNTATPGRLVFDKIDDLLGIDFTVAGGFSGTLVQASKEGVFSATVTVPAGVWLFAVTPAYFPSDNVLGLLLVEGALSASDIQRARTAFIRQGAGDDFAGASSMGAWFRGRTDLVTLDVSNWDTSSVTSFQNFATACSSLTALDVSSWDTSSVTSFQGFANGCSNLTALDVSSWDTSSVTAFRGFANGCSNLTALDVSNWDTSSVTDFSFFAYTCSSLTALDVSSWDTSSVTSFQNFAAACSSLTALNVSSWDTSSVTSFQGFANGCSNLTALDVSNWDTSSVTAFQGFANGCSNLTAVTVNGGTGSPFSDSPCTNYIGAFTNTNLTQQSIDDILAAIEAAGTSGGTFEQSGGSAPSVTGEAAITALRLRGWTVTVTGGF